MIRFILLLLPQILFGGTIDCFTFKSQILGNTRNIWVYKPNDYNPQTHYPLLLVFDGEAYQSLIPTPKILDQLRAEGKIPPVIAIFIGNIDRTIDLGYSPAFVKAVIGELLPSMESKYAISKDRNQRVVLGSSLGGMTASFVALSYPDQFGRVLSQSGSYGFVPNKKLRQPEGALLQNIAHFPPAREPIFFYLEAGEKEDQAHQGNPSTRDVNEKFVRVLEEKGHKVTYSLFPGGHDYPCWGASLPKGLEATIGERKDTL